MSQLVLFWKSLTFYGTVTSFDVLLQEFYHLASNKNEKYQVSTTRLEESLSKIRFRFPNIIREGNVECHLRHGPFLGVVKGLRDRFATFMMLLRLTIFNCKVQLGRQKWRPAIEKL